MKAGYIESVSRKSRNDTDRAYGKTWTYKKAGAEGHKRITGRRIT